MASSISPLELIARSRIPIAWLHVELSRNFGITATLAIQF